MDNVLHLLGIARKAGRVEVGEEPVGASARARQARLILVASDAADNSARRAAHFAQAGKAPWFRVPYTKGELGGTVGRASCAMLALTDVGLAAALLARLAAGAPETYGAASAELSEKADKALQRQKEQRRPEGVPAGARREADAAPGQADRQEEDAMRPWHTIGLEQRGLVPIRKRSGPAAFSYWRKPADGGGLFAEQQVSRA